MTAEPQWINVEEILAEPDDPVLGVDRLSEYTFCSRAGRCQEDKPWEDTGQDEYISPLDYLPEYDVAEIDDWNRTYSFRCLTWSVCFAGMLSLTVWWYRQQGIPAALIGGGITLFIFSQFIQDSGRLLKGIWKRARINRAPDTLPDPANHDVERANWWSFYRAGFDSQPVEDGFFDEELKLAGNPFKVLGHGHLSIPVFRRRNPGDLHPQHYVRIAAYCLLIERLTGNRAPYGLILDAGTDNVLAIKFNRESLDLLKQRLLLARRVIREAELLNEEPGAPDHSLCKGCPYGKPVPTETDRSLEIQEWTGLPADAEIGNTGRRYHSHCGDRFRWVPPHEKAHELLLPNIGSSR